jgi:isopenicillin-N N-acyltransferase-like protein
MTGCQWEYRQQHNLVTLHITQPGKPSISIITEGGIIGKIGLNSAGVGVCLNAIRAKGIDFTRLPTHLALRTALESRSRLEAVSALEAVGVGTSCHILVGDVTGGTGLEFSHADLKILETQDGKLCHSNHFVVSHSTGDGVPIRESVFLDDSKFRLSRMGELLEIAERKGLAPTVETVEEQLNDEENYPTAINRACRPGNEVSTLFSIVMDLTTKTARVRVGRPTESTETVVLHPVEKAE